MKHITHMTLVGLAALASALAPAMASASDGLIVKLGDGATPVNAPDLFANALSQSWGDGTRFCTAMKSLVAQDSANGTVTSCAAEPYATNGVTMSGGAPVVLFTSQVTLEGTSPFYNKTCPFTTTLDVSLQAPLNVTRNPEGGVTAVTFGSPKVTGSVYKETWSAPCTSQAGNHPGGVGLVAAGFVQTAASDVDFPGSALNNALAAYAATMQRDLSGSIYSVSTSTGDVVYTVGGSYLHSQLERAPEPFLNGAGKSAPSGGGAPAPFRPRL